MTQPNEKDIAKAEAIVSEWERDPLSIETLPERIAQALADERDATWDAAIEEVWALWKMV